jgi:protein-tyrosine phosphatase
VHRRVRLEDDFRHVVSLYMWERYALGPDTRLHEYEMYDATEMPDETFLTGIADDVNRYLIEGKTLVHCQAGVNRSNLVAALALIRGGRSPAAAVALLRCKRSPVVLCNQAFASWLLVLAVA